MSIAPLAGQARLDAWLESGPEARRKVAAEAEEQIPDSHYSRAGSLGDDR